MPKYLQRWILMVLATISILAVGQTVGCEVKAWRGHVDEKCVDVETRTLAVLLSMLTTLLGLSSNPNTGDEP